MASRAGGGLGRMGREAGAALLGAFDACDRRFWCGAGAAGFAGRRGWATKFEMRSPRYTARLDELPLVRAA